MNDVIFSENSHIFKIQYLRNYAIKMHRVNAKNFQKFFSNDLFHKINNASDFIAPFMKQTVYVLAQPSSEKKVGLLTYTYQKPKQNALGLHGLSYDEKELLPGPNSLGVADVLRTDGVLPHFFIKIKAHSMLGH